MRLFVGRLIEYFTHSHESLGFLANSLPRSNLIGVRNSSDGISYDFLLIFYLRAPRAWDGLDMVYLSLKRMDKSPSLARGQRRLAPPTRNAVSAERLFHGYFLPNR